jgi:hypothetical protein
MAAEGGPRLCEAADGRISKDEMSRIRANYLEIFERCQETYGCFTHATDPRSTFEVTSEERQRPSGSSLRAHTPECRT